MKRSEFILKLDDRPSPWAVSVAELAEQAGVKWDPEDRPLPASLFISHDRTYLRISDEEEQPDFVGPSGTWDSCFADQPRIQAVMDAAVRRYNLWSELVEIVGNDRGLRPGEDYACLNKIRELLS